MKKLLILLLISSCLISVANVYAATKYWKGGNSTWNTSGNWAPNGVPVAGDILVFDGNSTGAGRAPSISINVALATGYSRLSVINGCTASFTCTAARTLTVSTVFIAGDSQLIYASVGGFGTGALTISLPTNSVATVNGDIIFKGQTSGALANVLTSSVAGGIVFTNGATFQFAPGVASNNDPFNGSAAKSIVFQSGATYYSGGTPTASSGVAVGDPFNGKTAATTPAVFQSGSLLYGYDITNITFDGNTSGNIIMDQRTSGGAIGFGSGSGNAIVALNTCRVAATATRQVSYTGTGAIFIGGDFIVDPGSAGFIDSSAPVANTNFEVQGNFSAESGGFIPSEDPQRIYLLDGTSPQTVTLSTTSTSVVPNLTISNSAGVTLGSSLDVVTTLSLTNTFVMTADNTLILGTNATGSTILSYTSSTIIGRFARWVQSGKNNMRYVFPLGTVSTYNEMTVLFTTAPGTGGSLTTSFTPADPGSDGLPLVDGALSLLTVSPGGYWTISTGNASFSGGVYTLTLEANGFIFASATTEVRIIERANGSSNWGLNGTAGTNSGLGIVRTGMNSYGDYGLGYPLMSAGFKASTTSGLGPLVVNFTDTSLNSPTSWSWNFGDGGSTTIQNPSHTYGVVAAATTYTVSLVVSNAYGSSSASLSIYVTETAASAGFSASPTSGNGPLIVNFTDTTNYPMSSSYTTWSWNFGDGATTTIRNPSHTYAAVGAPTTYTVQLIVTTPFVTSTATQTNYIAVSELGPSAGFSGSPTSGNGPLTVNFTDTTNYPTGSSYTTWNWNFGDGATTTIQNPVHSYAAVGAATTYTVRLIVTTPFGVSTSTKTNYISVSEPSPSAGFSGSPTSGYGALNVNFVDTTGNLYGNSTSWSWNFGDGSTSNLRNPVHIYGVVTASTSYTVRLIVTTPFGVSTATQVNYIGVSEPPPSAGFSGSPTSGYGVLTVNFVDTTGNLYGNSTSWSWNFGDGVSTTIQNPVHSYGVVGAPTTYTVRLIVATIFGTSTSTKVNYITVTEPPASAGFSASPTSGLGPLMVNFTDTSGNNPTSWSWNFGDGVTTTIQNPVHTYGVVGAATTYTVSLVVSNVYGSTTATQTISVTEAVPGVGFSGSPTSGNGPLVVNFIDTTNYPISSSYTTWNWNFGDGVSTTIENPSHTYAVVAAPTTYTVRLIVTTPFGASTSTQTNYISLTESGPSAGFSGTPTSGITPLAVVFTDTTNYPTGSTYTTWAWDFGDGVSTTIKSPSHTYTTAGSYTVTLIVTTPFGMSTAIEPDYINTNAPIYKWNVKSGSWGTAGNWSPARSTPTGDDVLVFDGSVVGLSRVTATNVPTQTIGELEILNGCTASFTATAGVTLTISTPGLAFEVDSTSQLIYASVGGFGTGALTISLPTNSVATVNGDIIFKGQTSGALANVLTSSVAGGIVFTNGATFQFAPGVASNNDPFNGSAAKSIVFQSGATYYSGGTPTASSGVAVGDPFNGKTAATTPAVFQSGSLLYGYDITNITFDGNTSGNIIMDQRTSGGAIGFGSGSGNAIVALNTCRVAATATRQVSYTGTGAIFIGGDFIVDPGSAGFIDSSAPVANTNFEVQGNFSAESGGFIPSEDPQRIYLLDGTSPQTVTLSTTSTSVVPNLTISNSAGVTLGSSLDVVTTLSLTNTFVMTADNTLILGTNATGSTILSYTSSTIIGRFARWVQSGKNNMRYVFPLGTVSTYNEMTVLFTTAPGTGGSLTTSFTPADPGSDGLPLVDGALSLLTVSPGGYWTISTGNASFSGGVYTLTLEANGFIFASATTEVRIIERANGSSNWGLNGTAGTNSGLGIVRTGMNSYGDYGLGYPLMSAGFKASTTSGLGPLVVNFTDTSLNSPTSWSWNFGDGGSTTIQNPSHTYGVVAAATTYTVSLVVSNAYGSSSASLSIYVTETAASAGFSASPTSGNGPLIVNFTDTSGNNPMSWSWNFGDGASTTIENPSHTYAVVAAPTTYTVRLIVSNVYGSTTATRNISVTEPGPSAGFSGSPTSGNGALVVNFTDTTNFPLSSSYTTWNWNFGDGATATIENPSHTYAVVAAPTTYTVRLIVTTPFGVSTSTQTNYIAVTEPGPSAGFSANTTSGYGALTVIFSDTTNYPTSSSYTTWSWNFGDGATTTVRNPVHVYGTVTATTTYTVRMIVTTPFGTSTSIHINYITVTEPPPSVGFSASPTSGNGPLIVNFTDTTGNLYGNSTSWSWNFGDGASTTIENPSHTYTVVAAPTTYTVQLIVATIFGTSTATQMNYITVTEPGPSAGFSASPTSGNGPLTVNFTDTSMNLQGNSTTWNWNFGDGMTTTIQNPSHTYAVVGTPTTYTVQLVVTTPFGTSTSTQKNYISVTEPPPSAGFSASPTSGYGALTVNFTDTTGNLYGNSMSWSWNFGDGGSTTIENPSHTYAVVAAPTTYTVRLIVTTVFGTSTSTQANYIFVTEPAPVAAFNAVPASGNGPLTVNFTDTSANNPTSWSWNFGDGATTTIRNPSHTYAVVSAPTTYTVRFIATNIYGSTTATEGIFVTEASPNAGFSASTTSGNGPLTVNFTDTSANLQGSSTTWNWNFGDGATTTIRNPSHTYAVVGAATTYTVQLIVSTPYGTSTATQINYISVTEPSPIAGFSASTTIGFGPLTINFTDTSANLYSNTTSWNWNFGDGATTTIQNPSHTYALVTAPTYYTVRLIVSNTFGVSTISKTNYIYVTETTPGAGFYATPTSGFGPLSVSFVDTSSFNPISWLWGFGDGGNSNLQNPTHIYATVTASTTYTVRLIVGNIFGNTTISYSNYIYLTEPPPSPGFYGTPTIGYGPMVVNFTDTSGFNPTAWSWNFGDGGTSNLLNPSHTYSKQLVQTLYNVQLIESNKFGTNTITQANYITIEASTTAPPYYPFVPSLKLFLGEQLAPAFDLNDYNLGGTILSYTLTTDFLGLTSLSPSSYSSVSSIVNQMGYGVATSGTNYYESSNISGSTTMFNEVKYSSYIIQKLPKVGLNVGSSYTVNVANYTISNGSTLPPASFGTADALQVSDSTLVSAVWSGNTAVLVTALAPITNGPANVYVIAAPQPNQPYGDDMDEEVIQVYTNIQPNGTFTSPNDTTVYGLQIPPGRSELATHSWMTSYVDSAGTEADGIWQFQFNDANVGIEMTPFPYEYVPMGNNQWYTIRMRITADSTNSHQAYLYGFSQAAIPGITCDIGANIYFGIPTVWTWIETPLQVHASSTTYGFPQIQFKAGQQGNVYLDELQVINSAPTLVDADRYKTRYNYQYGNFDQAFDTTGWGQEIATGASGSPGVSVSNGALLLDFSGATDGIVDGIKWTANNGVIGFPATFAVNTQRQMGVRASIAIQSGNFNSLGIIQVSAYGVQTSGQETIGQPGSNLISAAGVGALPNGTWRTVGLAINPYYQMQFVVRNQLPGVLLVGPVDLDLDEDDPYYGNPDLFP